MLTINLKMALLIPPSFKRIYMYARVENLVGRVGIKSAKRYCSSCGYDKDEAEGDIVVSPKRPYTKRFVCKDCMVKRAARVSPKSRFF